jgi:hypothetical protein
MRKSIMILIICLFPVFVIGQRGYIIRDSTINFGIKINDLGRSLNSKVCSGIYNSLSFAYSPYEINEYGFSSGKVYISKEITIADSTFKAFLKREVNGTTKLYYYSNKKAKTFFLDKGDDKLIELPKLDQSGIGFQDKLNALTTDCQGVSEEARLVNYNSQSLSLFINRYSDCEVKYFPLLKLGLIASFGFVNLSPSSWGEYPYLGKNDLVNINMYTLGFFIDNPILASIFSFHAELNYSLSHYYLTKQNEVLNFNLEGKWNSFSLPLMIKVALPFNKIQPYINCGIIQSCMIKKEYTVYETSIYDNFIEINKIDYNNSSGRFQSGIVIGMGAAYKLSLRNYLSVEMRYKNILIPYGSGLFGESGISILTSISF